jgi:hypothetical protein
MQEIWAYIPLVTQFETIIIIFRDYVMRGLFRPLEEYACPSILDVVYLCFIFLLGCMLEFSSVSACVPFVACDICTVIRNLKFQHLDLSCSAVPYFLSFLFDSSLWSVLHSSGISSLKLNSMAVICKRTIPNEQSSLVDEVRAKTVMNVRN